MLSLRNTLQALREPFLQAENVKSSSLPCLTPSRGCTTTCTKCASTDCWSASLLWACKGIQSKWDIWEKPRLSRDKVSWKCKRCSLVHYKYLHSSWTLGSPVLLQFWLSWKKFEFKSSWNLVKWNKNGCILWRFCDLHTKTQSKLPSVLVRL